MLVSIGILARNEAQRIEHVIADLRKQTVLDTPGVRFDLHVVANGCTDDTADTARRALGVHMGDCPSVGWTVHELGEAGKANAWNRFVHELADRSAEYVFLLDADIRLVDNSTMAATLDALQAAPDAVVATDEPVKDVSSLDRRSLFDRVLLSFSQTATNVSTSICGQFYCARRSALADIVVPTGLIGEDGYMRAMLLTNGFTEPERLDRLVFVAGAQHTFETRRELGDIFHHQVRLALGTALNVLLFLHLHGSPPPQGVRAYVAERNATDPNWLNDLVAERMRRVRYFVMDPSFLRRRWRVLRDLPPKAKVRKLPVIAAGSVIDVGLYLRANQLLRRRAAVGYW